MKERVRRRGGWNTIQESREEGEEKEDEEETSQRGNYFEDSMKGKRSIREGVRCL